MVAGGAGGDVTSCTATADLGGNAGGLVGEAGATFQGIVVAEGGSQTAGNAFGIGQNGGSKNAVYDCGAEGHGG
jgi:hypothetical protein